MKVATDTLLWRRYCVDAFICVKSQFRASPFCNLVLKIKYIFFLQHVFTVQ